MAGLPAMAGSSGPWAGRTGPATIIDAIDVLGVRTVIDLVRRLNSLSVVGSRSSGTWWRSPTTCSIVYVTCMKSDVSAFP